MTQLSSLQKLLVNVLEDKTVTLVDDKSETCNHWLKKQTKKTDRLVCRVCARCVHIWMQTEAILCQIGWGHLLMLL